MISEPEQGAPAGDAGLVAAAAAIDAEAAAAAATIDPGAPGAAPAAPADWPSEARHLVKFVCTSILPIWPSLKVVYTDDVQKELAAAAAPLMQKYDFDLARLLARFWPEISFAMVALPLVIPTVDAIKADRAEARAAAAAKKATAAGTAAAPGGDLHTKA